MTNHAPRPCPICSGEAKDTLFQQAFEALSEGSLTSGYDVVVCRTCGFAFADRIPDQASFNRYYAEMSKYEYEQRGGKESPTDLARFVANAEEVLPFLPSPSARILDLGCSTGGLLSILRERGYPEVFGLDPSPACAREAWDLYKVKVFTGTIGQNNLPPEPFDFIIMVGVLEHVRDLGPAMETISKHLTPTGRILMEVPDARGFADWPDAPYQQFSTEHICFFSPASLNNLMRRHGFSLVNERVLPRPYTTATMMPVVSSVFQRGASLDEPLVRDTETEPALRRYIAQSAAVEDRIQRVIAEVADSRRDVLVWGVGTHTQRLMETSRLAEANIAAFVDSNAKYQSRLLRGVPIISPAAVRDRPEPILISSRVFQDEICDQIRNELGYPNELIRLYET